MFCDSGIWKSSFGITITAIDWIAEVAESNYGWNTHGYTF